MSNARKYEIKREAALEKYKEGLTDPEKLSVLFDVRPSTVETWIWKYGWKELAKEVIDLEKTIERNMLIALNKGLEAYIENPADTSLQSLVALLKEQMNKNKPSRELNEYIVKFLGQTVDFFIGKGLEDMRQSFQENLIELAEYLRVKNNG